MNGKILLEFKRVFGYNESQEMYRKAIITSKKASAFKETIAVENLSMFVVDKIHIFNFFFLFLDLSNTATNTGMLINPCI